MSSNLKVNTILPSTGSNVAIGTAGGTVTMVGNVDIDINSGISTFNDIHVSDKIVHDGDTNTSLRFPAADTITAETSGSERLRITSGGSVGIGTIPASGTTLDMDASGGGVLVLRRNSVSTSNKISLSHDGTNGTLDSTNAILFRAGGSEKLRIDSNGHFKATNGSTSDFNTIQRASTSNYAGIRIQDADATQRMQIGVAGGTNNICSGAAQHDVVLKSYANLLLATNQTERLRIDSSGLLLVGTSSDVAGGAISSKIQVRSASYDAAIAIVANRSNTAGGNLSFTKTRGTSEGDTTIVQSGDTLGTINFFGADGTADEANAAGIYASVDGTPGINDMPGRLIFATTADGAASPTERLRIDKRGAVTKPHLPAFFARPPGGYSLGDNVNAVIGGTWSTSDAVAFARGTLPNGNSVWSNTNGIFTVPVAGIYYFHLNIFIQNNSTRRDAFIFRNGTANGNIVARTEIQDDGSGMNKSVSVSAVLSLSQSDTIRFGGRTQGGTTLYTGSAPWSYACGHLVG